MKKYYYKHDGWKCLEKCHIHKSAHIGSGNCMDCKHYEDGSRTEKYVICKHLPPKCRINWKKMLLRIAAVFLYVVIGLFTYLIGFKINYPYYLLFSTISGATAMIIAIYLWNLSNKK